MLLEKMVEMSCNEPCLSFHGCFFQPSVFYIQELQCPLVDILTYCIQQHYSAFDSNVLPVLLPLLRCNYFRIIHVLERSQLNLQWKIKLNTFLFFSLYITNVFQVSQARWEQKIKAQDSCQKEDAQPWIQWSKINLTDAWFTDSVPHIVFINANSILSITGVFLWDQVCWP